MKDPTLHFLFFYSLSKSFASNDCFEKGMRLTIHCSDTHTHFKTVCFSCVTSQYCLDVLNLLVSEGRNNSFFSRAWSFKNLHMSIQSSVRSDT